MSEQSRLDEAYLSAQFAGIQKRISARDRSRRRRRTMAWFGGGIVASLAITGGAIAVIQATETEKSASLCFEAASPDSSYTEIGDATTDGTVDPLPGMSERVDNAEAQCSALWSIGNFTPEGSSDGTDLPAPALFTCVLADGRLGVFPVTDGADCESLDLRDP